MEIFERIESTDRHMSVDFVMLASKKEKGGVQHGISEHERDPQ